MPPWRVRLRATHGTIVLKTVESNSLSKAVLDVLPSIVNRSAQSFTIEVDPAPEPLSTEERLARLEELTRGHIDRTGQQGLLNPVEQNQLNQDNADRSNS
jgi:hypothetical protein